MRILHLVRQFSPSIGGLESYVACLAEAQGAAGHQVTVVTLDRVFAAPEMRLPAEEERPLYGIRRIPYRGSTRYPLAPGFLRHLAEADIVHVHAIDFFFDMAALARLWQRKPMVVSTHGGFFHTGRSRRLKQVYFNTVTRLSLRAYGAVLASSVNDFELFAPLGHPRLIQLDNGVDITKFAGRGSPGLTKELCFLGRFSANKRLDRLVAMLAALRRRDPAWRLTIAGVESDLTCSDLRRLIAAEGQEDAVTLLVGASDGEIAQALGRCSFIASASEYEGFGIAVVEGMSAGLLPVVNDIPAYRRLHQASGLGLLADFADPEAVAERLVTLDAATGRQAAMAFAQGFGWPAVAARIEAIYDELAGAQQRRILGVPVTVATKAQAVARLDDGSRHMVAFLNAHAANLAWRDRAFAQGLERFLVLNDGFGIDLASRFHYGRAFPDNLNGTDFLPDYLAATRHRFRIFLLGARPEVVAAAAAALTERFPQHQVVGWRDGYFDLSAEGAIAEQIRRSGADLLLVGMGVPRQELWLARNFEETGCRLGFAVGALFDFLSGRVRRAPLWLRGLRAEWLFRLCLEPRRLWRRYVIGNALFLLRVGRMTAAGRRTE